MDIINWKDKNLTDLTLLELAYAHLGHHDSYQLKDGRLESILPITLSEINHVRTNIYSRNFVPIVGAFGVIEQIGFCYQRRDMPKYSNEKASPICKALYYFAGFEEVSGDVKALYALRNSFLHTGSLLSKAEHKNKISYYFGFNREMSEIVRHSIEVWDGNIETLAFKNKITWVNPEKIIDLAFSIRKEALSCISKGVLEVGLKHGKKELYYRFLKHYPYEIVS